MACLPESLQAAAELHAGHPMTALRRTVRIRRGQMLPLDLQTICDKCNKSRAHGNHEQCSKQRQADGIVRRAGEKQQ